MKGYSNFTLGRGTSHFPAFSFLFCFIVLLRIYTEGLTFKNGIINLYSLYHQLNKKDKFNTASNSTYLSSCGSLTIHQICRDSTLMHIIVNLASAWWLFMHSQSIQGKQSKKCELDRLSETTKGNHLGRVQALVTKESSVHHMPHP